MLLENTTTSGHCGILTSSLCLLLLLLLLKILVVSDLLLLLTGHVTGVYATGAWDRLLLGADIGVCDVIGRLGGNFWRLDAIFGSGWLRSIETSLREVGQYQRDRKIVNQERM